MTIQHQCKHCGELFKRTANFEKHSCRNMKRYDIMKTVKGQIAYQFFVKWQQRRKRTATAIADFIECREFNALCKFAEFIQRVKGLSDNDIFIELMVANKIGPSMWCDDIVFTKYLLYIANHTSVDLKMMRSIRTLEDLADDYGCKLKDVFLHIDVNTVLQKIREQKLSPWVLLASQKFFVFLETLNRDQQSLFDRLIDPIKWRTEFNKDPDQVMIIKKCLHGLKLLK